MRRWVVLGAVTVLLLALALAAFEPWRILTSSRVDEALPRSAPVSDTPTGGDSSGRPRPQGTGVSATDRVLVKGDFEDAEHATSGSASVLELADGRRFVRLEDLATSDGPDLHVWLTDRESGGDWGSYDDGRYLRLGELKATHGSQNYAVPEGTDLAGLRSVVIWCDRFNVAFGTAPLAL